MVRSARRNVPSAILVWSNNSRNLSVIEFQQPPRTIRQAGANLGIGGSGEFQLSPAYYRRMELLPTTPGLAGIFPLLLPPFGGRILGDAIQQTHPWAEPRRRLGDGHRFAGGIHAVVLANRGRAARLHASHHFEPLRKRARGGWQTWRTFAPRHWVANSNAKRQPQPGKKRISKNTSRNAGRAWFFTRPVSNPHGPRTTPIRSGARPCVSMGSA